MCHHLPLFGINPDNHVVARIADHCLQLLNWLDRDSSNNCASHTQLNDLFDISDAAQTAAELNRNVDSPDDIAQCLAIPCIRFPKRTIEIHDVEHLRSRSCESFGHVDWIAVINLCRVFASLSETNATTITKINCRKNYHEEFLRE